MTTEQFAIRFKAARLATGLTQVQVAERVGVPQSRIAEWETGKQMPRIGMLMGIIANLDLDPRVIFPEFAPYWRRSKAR